MTMLQRMPRTAGFRRFRLSGKALAACAHGCDIVQVQVPAAAMATLQRVHRLEGFLLLGKALAALAHGCVIVQVQVHDARPLGVLGATAQRVAACQHVLFQLLEPEEESISQPASQSVSQASKCCDQQVRQAIAVINRSGNPVL